MGEIVIGIQPDKVGEESYSAKRTEFLLDRGKRSNPLIFSHRKFRVDIEMR